MIGEIGTQVADIVRTEGKITATEKASERMATASDTDRAAAIKQLEKDKKEVTDKTIHDQMYQSFYNDEFARTELGTGGRYQRVITAATSAIQALAGGNINSAVAGAAAPYIANEIAARIPVTDPKGRILAHAVVNAALAAASGKDGAAAAAGAATGELAGIIATTGFHKDVSELSEEEKQTVSALATLASGLAGALVGDSGTNAVAAAQVGKTTVENNFLGSESRVKLDKAVENQQNGKDLLAASKEIVRQNNIDRHSDELLGKFQTDPQSMTESERQQLAAYLNVYGYELQASYGLNPEKAQQLVNSLLSGEPALKPSPGYPGGGGDTSSYYEALGYLKMYSVQSSQAAMGTDALLTLPGGVGTAARATLAAGGAYQTGTGIGQLIDGQYGEGALNVGLGSAAIFGSVAGQSVIKKTDTGIFSPESIISLQESSRSTGKNIFPVDMFKISPENLKYVDILSPEARQHILYGESLTGGGHMYPGNPGETIFPPTWSANKIVHEVGEIATSPNTQWYAQTGTGGTYTSKGKPANWVSYEERGGVRIRVVYQPATGKVITAFPDASPIPNSYKPIK